MNRFGILAIMFCLIIILGAGTVNDIKAGDKCYSHVTLHSDDDYGTVLAERTYDPCDANEYTINYRIEFSRTGTTNPSTKLCIRVIETGLTTSYMDVSVLSWNYLPGTQDHVLTGSFDNFGTSSSHTFQIIKDLGNSGDLYDIDAEITYVANQGTPH